MIEEGFYRAAKTFFFIVIPVNPVIPATFTSIIIALGVMVLVVILIVVFVVMFLVVLIVVGILKMRIVVTGVEFAGVVGILGLGMIPSSVIVRGLGFLSRFLHLRPGIDIRKFYLRKFRLGAALL